MNSFPPATETLEPPDAATGLPGFRSWRAVYIFVLAVLATWVGLLTTLTLLYG